MTKRGGMTVHQDLYEKILIEKLSQDDQSAFSTIFTKYYKDLVRFSMRFTHDTDAAEELVQDVFVKLWENRSSLNINNSLKSFLVKTVQNRCIDHLRFVKIRNKHASQILENLLLSDNETEKYILHSELETHFGQALSKLPNPLAEVYKMSRIESLSYQEIALKLGVSVRTIEVRIAKALQFMRAELTEFLLIFLFHLLLF